MPMGCEPAFVLFVRLGLCAILLIMVGRTSCRLGLLVVVVLLGSAPTGEAAPFAPALLTNLSVTVTELPAAGWLCAAGQCVQPAWLSVATSPWTEVLIDGRLRGSTPLYRERLLPGRYRVQLRNAAAGVDLIRELEVGGATLTKMSAAFGTESAAAAQLAAASRPVAELAGDCGLDLTTPAFLSVATTPWTRVVVDGKPIGATPLYRAALAPGRHIVRLVNEAEGVDYETEVTLTAGETTKLRPIGWLGRGRGEELLVGEEWP